MKGLRQGYWSRVTKGTMSAWKGEWENIFSGMHMDSVQEETLEVIVNNEHKRPLLLNAQTQIDGRMPSKGIGPRGESPSGRKGQKACNSYRKGNCTNPSCGCWHPPVCQNYKSEAGTQSLMGSPVKKSKKSGETGFSCLTEGD